VGAEELISGIRKERKATESTEVRQHPPVITFGLARSWSKLPKNDCLLDATGIYHFDLNPRAP